MAGCLWSPPTESTQHRSRTGCGSWAFPELHSPAPNGTRGTAPQWVQKNPNPAALEIHQALVYVWNRQLPGARV